MIGRDTSNPKRAFCHSALGVGRSCCSRRWTHRGAPVALGVVANVVLAPLLTLSAPPSGLPTPHATSA